MDDFTMKGELMRDTLDKLGSINKWLGGNRITLDGIAQLLKGHSKDKIVTIIDLGCGHGDILRLVADFGRKKGCNFKLIGIDANQDAIDYANELSVNYPELSFRNEDIFSEAFQEINYDIALTNGSSGSNFIGNHSIGDNLFIVMSYDLATGNIQGWINPDSASLVVQNQQQILLKLMLDQLQY